MAESRNAIHIHDRDAAAYDEFVAAYGSYVHDVLFGLCFEYVRRGDSLLDLGIGTGLSSAPFAKAGAAITGVDGSQEMLEVCQRKGIAAELRCHDLLETPLPYPAAAFNHVIACGVFHFFADLDPLVGEACRLMQQGGTFAFTAVVPDADATDSSPAGSVRVRHDAAAGVSVYAHRPAYVHALLESNGLVRRKQQHFTAHSVDYAVPPLMLAAYVAQKPG